MPLKDQLKRATAPTPIKPAAPEIEVPPVDIEPIAHALGVLAEQIATLGQLMLETMAAHDKRLIDHAERVETLLETLAEAPAPVVNVPAIKSKSARVGYDIVLVKDEVDNEILGMRLRPVPPGN